MFCVVGVLLLNVWGLTDWSPWLLWASELYIDAAVVLRAIWTFIFDHSEKLTALIGFSFGIYKWWYYRERVLHKRLDEYLRQQESRLIQARAKILDAIEKPGGQTKFAAPLFAVHPLREVLAKLGWVPRLSTASVEGAAYASLGRALQEIDEKTAMARAAQQALNAQKATAHMLRGAIAAARAGNAWSSVRRINLDQEALGQFRLALEVPGKDHLLQTKEYEVRQLLRVGDLDAAMQSCQKFEVLAMEQLEGRDRDLAVARARKWRAILAQAKNEPAGSTRARRWMNGESDGLQDGQLHGVGALPLRAQYAPFERWDAIEQADMHYTAAFIRNRLTNTIEEGNELTAARSVYEQVQRSLPQRQWRMSAADKKLREACEIGLARVAKAPAQYDLDWLLPPRQQQVNDAAAASLDGSQNPSQAISGAGSKDGVAQAS